MRTWLVEIRKAAKKSQQAVADAAGISQTYYAGIETGARGKPLGVPVAKAIAGALGFDWTWFYDEEKSAFPVYRVERSVHMEQTRKRSELSTEELEAIFGRMKTYTFEGYSIRCVENGGQQWVVLADACRALGYKNSRHQAKYIQEQDKRKLDIGLKNTLVNCVNRNGLRRMCLLSSRAVGLKLSDWADAEIFAQKEV